MFGKPLETQKIIKIDTVKEISDKSDQTLWKNKLDFKILGLPTKRNLHFFFTTSGRHYSATILRSEIESYNWQRFEVVRFTESEWEKLQWKIYDEIIEDLGIQ
jgi:hypothetical protein